MKDRKDILVANLNWLLKQRELNPNSLAAAIGDKSLQVKLFRIISGETKNPRRDSLAPVAAYFGVEVSDLWDWDFAKFGWRDADRAAEFDKIKTTKQFKAFVEGAKNIPGLTAELKHDEQEWLEIYQSLQSIEAKKAAFSAMKVFLATYTGGPEPNRQQQGGGGGLRESKT